MSIAGGGKMFERKWNIGGLVCAIADTITIEVKEKKSPVRESLS
jgi:hypothetical protein